MIEATCVPSQRERQRPHTVVVEKNVPTQTRDRPTLYSDNYRPDADGRCLVLVVPTPIHKGVDLALTEQDYFPQRGYVVVVQDTWGHFRSGGEFSVFIHQAQDGYDTNEGTRTG